MKFRLVADSSPLKTVSPMSEYYSPLIIYITLTGKKYSPHYRKYGK